MLGGKVHETPLRYTATAADLDALDAIYHWTELIQSSPLAVERSVHGAIGVTAEFDLQLITRRLQQWRGDHGGAAYWQARLGRALVAARGRAVVPFLLDDLLPDAAARGGSVE